MHAGRTLLATGGSAIRRAFDERGEPTMREYRRLLWFVLAMGCGGSTVEQRPAEAAAPPPRRQTAAAEPQVTGLLGMLTASEIQSALGGRTQAFLGCFADRMGEIEFLAGDVRLSFRIGAQGDVEWVYPESTTVGDRAAEQCVLDIAARTHFPSPRGGDAAEFTWGFAFDAPQDVRSPVEWDATQLAEVVLEQRNSIHQVCGRAGYRLTAYVSPGGNVLSVGGASPDAASLSGLDCVIAQVRNWRMPNPGSYAAKVTFDLR